MLDVVGWVEKAVLEALLLVVSTMEEVVLTDPEVLRLETVGEVVGTSGVVLAVLEPRWPELDETAVEEVLLECALVVGDELTGVELL